MNGGLQRALLRAFGLLPGRARRAMIHLGAPSYQVGALCVIERADGRVLLVHSVYRPGWGLPGGLLKRREQPLDAVRREVREEVGIDVAVDPRPHVVVDSRHRRVDIVFLGRPLPDGAADQLGLASPEVDEARWYQPDSLPELQRETASALAELATVLGSGGAAHGPAES